MPVNSTTTREAQLPRPRVTERHGSADFQVCCIAGFQTRHALYVQPSRKIANALPIWKSAIRQTWKSALQTLPRKWRPSRIRPRPGVRRPVPPQLPSDGGCSGALVSLAKQPVRKKVGRCVLTAPNDLTKIIQLTRDPSRRGGDTAPYHASVSHSNFLNPYARQ